MKKFAIRLLCCFVPSRKLRHKIRENFREKIDIKESVVNPYFIINGLNNKVVAIDENGNEYEITHGFPGIKIEIHGDNNCIILPKCCNMSGCCININNANNVLIELAPIQHDVIRNLLIGASVGDNQRVKIGNNLRLFGGASISLYEQDASVIIGNDCLFSNSISFWATDGHSIIENETNLCLNRIIKPIVIGNHVWIGEGCKFTKNSYIPDNCIIGMGSVVTKKFTENNCIISGNPAKVIKKSINWDIKNPYSYQLQQNKKGK